MKSFRAHLATILSFLIIALSPGLNSYSALAQSFQENSGSAGLPIFAENGSAANISFSGTSATPQTGLISDTIVGNKLSPAVLPKSIPAITLPLNGEKENTLRPASPSILGTPIRNNRPLMAPPGANRILKEPAQLPATTPLSSFLKSVPSPENSAASHQGRDISDAVAGEKARWDGAGAHSGLFRTAGAAFGVGDNHTIRRHAEANAAWKIAFAESRTRTVYEQGIQTPSPTREQAVLAEALDTLRQAPETPDIAVEGLKSPVQWKDGLAKVARIVAGDFETPTPHYESIDNFLVSHNGFGGEALHHNVPSIYPDARILDPGIYDTASRLGILVNEFFELAAKMIARAEDAPWNEELSRRVHENARETATLFVASLKTTPSGASDPKLTALNLTEKVQRIVETIVLHTPSISKTQATNELLELGLQADRLAPEYFSDDPASQQRILNRIAALIAKGFAPQSINPDFVAAQAELDRVLEGSSTLSGKDLIGLAQLLKLRPADFDHLAQESASYIENLIGGHPLVQRPEAGPHSQVAGLALRMDKALAAGRDIKALSAEFDVKAEPLTSLWSLWTNSNEIGEIPVVKAPRAGKDIAGDIKEAEKKTISDQYLLAKERKHLKRLAKSHPISRRLLMAGKKIDERRKQLLEWKRDLPRIKDAPPEGRNALREKIKKIETARRVLLKAKKDLTKRIITFQKKMESEEMARLSLDVRKWFPSAKGFSVAGDYLFFPDSKQLDVLIIAPDQEKDGTGSAAPEELSFSILQELSHGKFDITGLRVGGRWLENSPRNWFRNRELAVHAFRGVSLWRYPVNDLADQVPIRELWPWVVDELADAERLTAGPNDGEALKRARGEIEIASNFLTAIDLDLNRREYGRNLFTAVRTAQAAGALFDRRTKIANADERIRRQKEILSLAIKLLKREADAVALKGRTWALEGQLARVFYSQHPLARLGQLGIVRARSAIDDSPHAFGADEAAEKLSSLSRESAQSADAEIKLNRLLALSSQNNDWRWKKIPTDVVLGQEFRLKGDGFNRSIGVTIRTGKMKGPLNELIFIAPREAGHYDVFINEAMFELDQDAGRAAILEWSQILSHLQTEGCSVSEAQDKADLELLARNISPIFTDRELLDRAGRDYDAGVRVEDISDDSFGAMRRAQAAADYFNAPHNNLSGEVLIAWAPGEDNPKTQALRSVAEKMAEIFAANGIHVQIVRSPTSPTWMSSAMRQSPYMAGFLLTETPGKHSVLMFGHDHGSLPEAVSAQILDLEKKDRNAVRRMDLSDARQARLVRDVDWWESDQAALRHKFRVEQIRKAGVGLVLDTPLAEIEVLFRSLGLVSSAMDTRGNSEMLAQTIRARPRKTVGARISEDGRVSIFDIDGQIVSPQDLSAVFTDYSLEHGTLIGTVYRTFAQTRLLDRIAGKRGVPVEVLSDIAGVDGDDVAISPKTPWKDARSQVFLAMEIVAVKGKGLRALAEELRGNLGTGLESSRGLVELNPAFIEKLWAAPDLAKLAGYFKPFESENAKIEARKVGQGIQVSVGEDWIYMKRVADGLDLYAESARKGGSGEMLRAATAYARTASEAAKPSRSLRISFIAFAAVIAVLTAMLFASTFAPEWISRVPVAGVIFHVATLFRDAGMWLLSAVMRPPYILKKIIDPIFSFLSAYFVLFYLLLNWGLMRFPAWVAYQRRSAKSHDLDSSLQGIQFMKETVKDMAEFYSPVWFSKDGTLRITPAIQRLPFKWMQPVYYTYFALVAIMKRIYENRAVNLRQVVNSKGQVIIRAVAELPGVILGTLKHGAEAVFAPVAGMGLPQHASRLSAPLPESLREHARSFFGIVSEMDDRPKIFDMDTLGIKLLSGGPNDLYGRAAGMDAVENHEAGFRESKKLFIKLLRGKRALFVVPQVTQPDGSKEDKHDKYGRFLFYAYVQDQDGHWFNVNKYVLDVMEKRGLANTGTGAPDAFIFNYYHLDLQPPQKIDSAGASPSGQNQAGFAAWDLHDMEPVFDEAEARAVLEQNGSRIDPSARLVLSTKFAGEHGEFLKERMGAITMGAGSQLIVMGAGVGRIGRTQISPKASLQVETSPKAPEGPAPIVFEDETTVEGDVVIRAEKGVKRLAVEPGVKFAGREFGISRPLVLRAGSDTIIKMTRGRLEVRRDFEHPEKITERIWAVLQKDGQLSSLFSDPSLDGLDLAAIQQWWRHSKGNRYEKVRLPRKPSPANLIKTLKPTQDYRYRLPDTREQGQTMVDRAQRSLRRSMRNKKYLLRAVRGDRKIKQALIAGLANYYQVRINRARESLVDAWNASQKILEEAVSKINKAATADFGKQLDISQIKLIVEDAALWQEELNKHHMRDYFDKYAPKEAWEQVSRLRGMQAQLEELQRHARYERGAHKAGHVIAVEKGKIPTKAEKPVPTGEVEERLKFLEDRLAGLGGLLWWGPLLFKGSASVIGAGPYFFSKDAPELKLYVVSKSGNGPALMPSPPLGFEKIPLPPLKAPLEIWTVGDEWLNGHSPEADKLLTRMSALGVTLWGHDMIGLASQDLSESIAKIEKKVPSRNLLALARELRSDLELADLALLSAAPGVAERTGNASDNENRVEGWVLRQELEGIVKKWVERQAAHPYDGGVGGLVVGDFTDGRPWQTLTREESIEWVRSRIREGASVDQAGKKLERAFKRAKRKNEASYLTWYPDALEEGQFVFIGHNREGRKVHVRVSVRGILGKEASPRRYIAYAMAETDPEERVEDEDRYDLVLEDIFSWPTEAQDRVFDDIAFQLNGLLHGKSLDQLRERDLIEHEDLNRIKKAVAGAQQGIKKIDLDQKVVIPWSRDGWNGTFTDDDVLRVAQGVSQYVYWKPRRENGGNPKRVLVGSDEGREASVRTMAQVMAGNYVHSGSLQESLNLASFKERLRTGKTEGYVLGVWIGKEEIRVLGQDGQPLETDDSNQLQFKIMKVDHVLTRDLNAAHQDKLIIPADEPISN